MLDISSLSKAVFACKWEYQNTNLMDPNCEWSFDVSILGFDGLIDVSAGPSGWSYCVGVKADKIIMKDCQILYKNNEIVTKFTREIGPLSTSAVVTQSHVLVTLDHKLSKAALFELSPDFSLVAVSTISNLEVGGINSCTVRSASYYNKIFSISYEDCPTLTMRVDTSLKVSSPVGSAAIIDDELFERDPSSVGAIRVARLGAEAVLVGDKPCGDVRQSCSLDLCSGQNCGSLQIQSVVGENTPKN